MFYQLLRTGLTVLLLLSIAPASLADSLARVEEVKSSVASGEGAVRRFCGAGDGLFGGGIGGTGAPVANIGGTGAPVAGVGGTGAPVASIGGTGAPVASIGGTGAPVASIGGTGAPVASIGGTGAPAAGIGGTGATVAGLGGTGAPAAGIGGTGAPAAGIGGTGIQVAGIVDDAEVPINVVDRENRSLLLAQGSQICAGDRLATGSQAKARLLFADGTKMMLRASTTVRVEQFAWVESDPSRAKFELMLEDGSVRVASGNLAKANPDAYRLITNNAEIRVLGTDYDVTQINVPKDKLESGTYVTVNTGKIRMQNGGGAVELEMGQSGAALLNQAPQRVIIQPGICAAQ